MWHVDGSDLHFRHCKCDNKICWSCLKAWVPGSAGRGCAWRGVAPVRRFWTHHWWGSQPAQRSCLLPQNPEMEWTPCQEPSDPAEPQKEEPQPLSGLDPKEGMANRWNCSGNTLKQCICRNWNVCVWKKERNIFHFVQNLHQMCSTNWKHTNVICWWKQCYMLQNKGIGGPWVQAVLLNYSATILIIH